MWVDVDIDGLIEELELKLSSSQGEGFVGRCARYLCSLPFYDLCAVLFIDRK